MILFEITLKHMCIKSHGFCVRITHFDLNLLENSFDLCFFFPLIFDFFTKSHTFSWWKLGSTALLWWPLVVCTCVLLWFCCPLECNIGLGWCPPDCVWSYNTWLLFAELVCLVMTPTSVGQWGGLHILEKCLCIGWRQSGPPSFELAQCL